MKDKIILFEEEKIKLINNLNDKENEYNLNKKKVSDLNQQMEDFKSMFNQKMEEIQNLKINKSKLETELNIANLELKQKGENIKQLEEKYQIIKNETLNNGKSTTANYNDNKNKLEKTKNNYFDSCKSVIDYNKKYISNKSKEVSKEEQLKYNEQFEKINQIKIIYLLDLKDQTIVKMKILIMY